MKFSPVIFMILVSSGTQCRGPGSGLDCSKFKNGRFVLVSSDPLMKGEIIRNGNTQVIRNFIKNRESVETIKWLSDCKYKIAEKGKSDSAWLTIAIIKIVDDTAYMQGSYPNIDYKPILKIVKVK